jgi:hypothetical protein
MNHTLLSKKEWCQGAPDSVPKDGGPETWRQRAYRELHEYLCRLPYDSGVAAQQGITFEAQVYKYAQMKPEELKGSERFKKIVNTVRGGEFQKFYTKDMELENVILRWYGILDVIFPALDYIIDIKTTANFKPSKYTASGQDLVYRYVTDCSRFDYLVAEWEKYPKIKNVYTLERHSIPLSDIGDVLKIRASAFLEWIMELGLYDLYVGCYSHKGQGWKSSIAKKGPEQEQKLEAFYQPYRDKYLAQFKREEF